MKKIWCSLSFLFLITTANAQQFQHRKTQPNNQVNQAKEKARKASLEMFKIKFITGKLNLTPQEATAFWPVYNEYKKTVAGIIKEKKESEIEMQEALLNARKKMALALKPILQTEARVNAALKVDREFLKKAKNEMVRRRIALAQRRK